MTLWTQRVQVLWRPELSFFEKRSDLLRGLEQADLLKEFKAGVDDVTVRIGPFEGMTVRVNGATCDVGSPMADSSRVRTALGMAMSALEPRDVFLGEVAVRCFTEVAGSPQKLQMASGAKLTAGLLPSATTVDWALLLDGQSPEVQGQFKVEFGVVSAVEAKMRLQVPNLGRVGSAGPQLPFQPDTNGLPECAFFFDWHWRPALPVSEDPYSGILSAWDAILRESQKLSEEVRVDLAPQVEEAHG